ncbi:MAG: 6-phosphofructokinase [Bacteroidota bacterium]|nr:6-phosphofructokinase [Bacteroidota bacterium]
MKLEKKLFQGKTLGILTGGGDTSALNASIDAIKTRASILGYNVYGILKGWKGLLGEGEIVDLTAQPYDEWYGGTALKSSRTNPFPTRKNPEDRVPQILKNLERYKIDVLVTIGGDDTNGAAKKLYEMHGIPVIGFPKTIDNDLRTRTLHHFKGEDNEVVVCPGFESAARALMELTIKLSTTVESHSRIMVMEIMGRDAGWLTGSATFGGAEIALVPEVEMTKERKAAFFEKVRETYTNSAKKSLIIAVSEGVRWYDEKKGALDVVCASPELDEFGHPRFGGISGLIASEISKNLGIEARAQITGYYARAGECRKYDMRLVQTLADKAADLIMRQHYGQMPVLNHLVNYQGLYEFNTSSIDMGSIGNFSLPEDYYDSTNFKFTEKYMDFLSHILEKPVYPKFEYHFPKVTPVVEI